MFSVLLDGNIVPGCRKLGHVLSFVLEFAGRLCLTDRGYESRTLYITTVLIQFHAHLHISEHQFRLVHVVPESFQQLISSFCIRNESGWRHVRSEV